MTVDKVKKKSLITVSHHHQNTLNSASENYQLHTSVSSWGIKWLIKLDYVM
jgi:hypothetical protein